MSVAISTLLGRKKKATPAQTLLATAGQGGEGRGATLVSRSTPAPASTTKPAATTRSSGTLKPGDPGYFLGVNFVPEAIRPKAPDTIPQGGFSYDNPLAPTPITGRITPPTSLGGIQDSWAPTEEPITPAEIQMAETEASNWMTQSGQAEASKGATWPGQRLGRPAPAGLVTQAPLGEAPPQLQNFATTQEYTNALVKWDRDNKQAAAFEEGFKNSIYGQYIGTAQEAEARESYRMEMSQRANAEENQQRGEAVAAGFVEGEQQRQAGLEEKIDTAFEGSTERITGAADAGLAGLSKVTSAWEALGKTADADFDKVVSQVGDIREAGDAVYNKALDMLSDMTNKLSTGIGEAMDWFDRSQAQARRDLINNTAMMVDVARTGIVKATRAAESEAVAAAQRMGYKPNSMQATWLASQARSEGASKISEVAAAAWNNFTNTAASLESSFATVGATLRASIQNTIMGAGTYGAQAISEAGGVRVGAYEKAAELTGKAAEIREATLASVGQGLKMIADSTAGIYEWAASEVNLAATRKVALQTEASQLAMAGNAVGAGILGEISQKPFIDNTDRVLGLDSLDWRERNFNAQQFWNMIGAVFQMCDLKIQSDANKAAASSNDGGMWAALGLGSANTGANIAGLFGGGGGSGTVTDLPAPFIL